VAVQGSVLQPAADRVGRLEEGDLRVGVQLGVVEREGGTADTATDDGDAFGISAGRKKGEDGEDTERVHDIPVSLGQ
jgi:hypothetical protein